MRRTFLLLLLFPVLHACRDTNPTEIAPSEDALGAVVTSGNPDFFFLQPVVKSQPTIPSTSQFNPNLLPEVIVCPVGTDAVSKTVSDNTLVTLCEDEDQSSSTIPKAQYSAVGGAVKAVAASKHYQLNWDTGDVPLGSYTLFVHIGELFFGRFDVTIQSSSTGRAKRDNEDVVLQDGRIFPVKFYMGTRAVPWAIETQYNIDLPDCSLANDCVVQSVATNAPGTVNVVTPNKDAGVALTPQWAAGYPYPVVNVIIYRENRNCLPTGPGQPYGMQKEGCYNFSTFPVLEDGFKSGPEAPVQVRVEVCIEPDADLAQYDLWKHSSFGPEEGLTKLEAVPDQLIDCSGFAPSPQVIGSRSFAYQMLAGLRAIGRPLASAFAPSLLYAGDTGAGGLAGSFSTIGWAQTRDFAIVSGDGQTGPAGQLLANPLRVRVTTGHDHHADEPTNTQGLGGVPVTFTIGSGGGYLSNENRTIQVLTDGSGYASTPWYVGTTGVQQVIASVPWGDDAVFSATVSNAPGGPVSHWSMQEMTGYTIPDVLGPNDGTIVPEVNGRVGLTPGVSGNALEFFGPTSEAIMLAQGIGIDNALGITLSTWVRLDVSSRSGLPGVTLGESTTVQRFVSLGDENVEKAVIRLDGYHGNPANTLHFYVNVGSPKPNANLRSITAPGVLTRRNCFYHVAGTYDGSVLRLYLNGTLQGEPMSAPGSLINGNGVRLSNDSDASGVTNFEMLDGALDEVKVYNRALTAAEVQSLFSQHSQSSLACVNQTSIN